MFCPSCGENFVVAGFKVESEPIYKIISPTPTSRARDLAGIEIRYLLPICPICKEPLHRSGK